MRWMNPLDPIADRLLKSNESLRPDQRFAQSWNLLLLLSATVFEFLLALASCLYGQVAGGCVHGLLTLWGVGLLLLQRRWSKPWFFALAFGVMGWAGSATSLFLGMGAGVLLWHLLLPAGSLLLKGERWGGFVLVADIGLAAVQTTWMAPRLTELFQDQVHILPMMVCWEIASASLFFTLALFLQMLRQTLAAYQVERGQAMDLLSKTKDSETKWADQARFLETLMDVIPFPLFHKGPDGQYVRVNASFRVVFDVQKDSVTGQRNEAFLRPENAKTLAKIELDLLARDSMAVEEIVLIHADGHPHDFIVYFMPFVDGNQDPQGYIGVLIDITERKNREQKLVQLNTTKDQLFSIISHDLRGPVGKLKQLLDIYIDDPSIFDKATWDQVFHDMRRSSDSLFQLLENLLSWARAQQGQVDVRYESVPLEPIVFDVFSVLKLLASEKKISLEMDLKLEGPVLTDRHVLSTIIRNLVHNALKFSLPGGTILVSANETIDDLWIEVKDTGVGMDEETVRKIFRKRERISTFGTSKEKGQGIGLGLCLDLAQSLGADLEVVSALGKGTSIRLHLPTQEL